MTPHFADRMRTMKPSTIREMLKMTERPDVISFAGGLPAPELFPVNDIRVAAERVLTEAGPQAFQYGVTQGISPLREQIAQTMAERQIPCDAEDILITTGSQQGLDLLGKIFINAGDTILTENPTYLAAIQSFQCFQANFQAVPTDDDGLIPEAIGELAAKQQIRFLYVIPNFQNPTGRTLSLERRRKLMEIASRHDLLIIEDDPYGRLRYRGEHLPPLKSFDTDGRVIYLSTFSKTVAPGFRTAWIVASKPILDKLIIAKQAADLHTSSFDQLVLDRYLRDFDNHLHVEKVCSAYGERYAVMHQALTQHLPAGFNWTRPEGGMFLWVTGPQDFDAFPLFATAIEHGVAFVPGADFFVGDEGRNCLRLNFSNAQPEAIRKGIARLAELCQASISA